MLDVSELNRLAADLAKAGPTAQVKGVRVLDRTANAIVDTAQRLVPRDTGATANSIGADLTQEGDTAVAVIGPTTEYAPHLEFGTVHMAPRAFMGPALDRHTPAFVQAVAELGGDIL